MISGLEIRGNGSYRVYLVLESGKRRVPLTSYISNDEKTHQRTAEAIAAFLNVKNYGFESFPDPDSEQLVLRTREEEIAHWQAVLQTNSNDADAFFNLGWALYRQDKIRNRKQVRNYVKQAISLYKAQGYKEQASQVATFWRLMCLYEVEEAYTVLKLEDGTYLKIEGGTNLKVVEHTKTKLILQDPKPEIPPAVIYSMIGCLAPFVLAWSSAWFFSGLFVVRDCLEQLYTAQLQIKGDCSQGLTSALLPLVFGIFSMSVAVLPIIVLVLSMSSSSTCTFDKILGSVIITNKNLLRTKVIKCSLYEVVDVQIEERTEAEENHRYQVYRVVLVLSSGKGLPLTPFPKDAEKHPHQIINLIKRFLSLASYQS
jgi:hypothetical protein